MTAPGYVFRGKRQWGKVAAICLLLLATGLIFAATGSEAANPPCPIPGNFEIDGDMLQNTCSPPGNDWNTPGLGVQTSSQGGTYNTNNKDADPTSGWTSGGGTPDKADFQRAYSFARVVGGHYMVFLAWERTATSGTQSYNIELDNSGANVAADGTPQPNRSNGGAVFYIDAQGGGLPTFGSDCTFTSQANYGSTCSNTSAGFFAAFNTADVTDPLNGNAAVAAGGFDEIALDVTALTGVAPSCPGPSAASLYLRSATGTNHKNLKGYLAPFVLQPDSTCVPPPISTTATPGGPANATGSTQHDTVTVGTAQKPGVGSVKFFLCSPANLTNAGDCATGGTQVGLATTLDANGQAASDDVTGLTNPSDNANGKYCWRAEFTPSANDHNYVSGSDSNGDTSAVAGAECFTIVHGTPSIGTQISVTGANAPGLGYTTLGDTATLTGTVTSTDLEQITFDLYGPYAAGVTPTCTGNPAFTTTGFLLNGSATTSATFTPTQAGTYVWVASYGGDLFNDAVSGKCTDANESATIVASQIQVAKSANPAGPVSAGTGIGFDVTVTNPGTVAAADVHVTDNLPAGADGVANGDLSWSLAPAYTGCAITGLPGSQVLDCTFGKVDPGSLPAIHISSSTTPHDCGTVKNKASVTATNGTGGDSNLATVTVQCPHLTIDKTADAASVNAGSPIGFTITAGNDGQGTATGVLVNDPLPSGPGITWSIQSATGPLTCGIAAGTLTCTGSLGAGATETVHVTSPTSWTGGNTPVNSCLGGPKNDGVYPNTAQISATNVLDSPSDDATTEVLCPDLHITKTHDAASVNAGTDIGFTITASNTGAGDATGALVNDPLPGTVSWSIDAGNTSGPLTCGIAAGTLTCTGTLGAGATETVHITAPTTRADCATYDNTATLTATNTPQAPNGHDSTQVLCADVVVQKTADASSVSVGTDIGFTVTIGNNGAGDALGVDVEDPLPAGSGVNWSIDAGGTSGPLTCAINGAPPSQTLKCTGDLAASGKAGDTQTVHITSGTVWSSDHNSCGTYDNTATVTWTFGPRLPLSSNLATETVLCPDLSVTKTADDASVSAGSAIGFTVAVTNAGPGTATSVTLNDPLPAGANVDWSISPAYAGPGTCGITGQAGSQTLTCSFGDLAPKASFFVHISSATTYGDCGRYDNTATLHATNEPGIAPGSDSTKVLCPDVTLTKTADDKTVSAGDQIGFTITASNGNAPGTGTATGVVLDDPLPAGGGVDWSIASGPDNCSIQGNAPTQTLHCTAVDLAPGDSETVHVVSGTDKTSCQAYPNTVTLDATNHARMTDDATTTVLCADIKIVKAPDAAQVSAGDQIGFTMVVFNPGAGDATGATLKDTLPTNPGLHWTIASQGGGWTKPCTITAGVLTCGPDTVPAGTTQASSTFTVHITSTTDKTTGGTCVEDSGVVNNEGDVTTVNDGSDKSTASLCVASPSLKITKTADHSAPVNAGDSIGFTVEVKNAGQGDATGVNLADALPAGSGSGVTWVIDPAVGTPAQFVLAGAKGAQTLSLASGTVPAGADYKVHVTAATSQTECSVYDNTATLTLRNGTNPEPASASESCAYRVDLSITKAGSPATQDLGQGNITWTIVVTNNGPDTDTGVTIADPMPAGNTFVSATTSQGTCTGGAILNCTIGTMNAGATATITLVTKPSAAGAQTNTATVVGALPETNTANNQASATVQVTAPFVPPPVYCVAVSKITPHQLFVGRKTMLTIHLTKHGKAAKGVRVLIKGPKLHVTTKRSNGRGIVKQVVKMKKAGIDTFIPLANMHCNTKRLGVTGVFTPPVTG